MELPQKILRPWLMVLQSIFQSKWNKREPTLDVKALHLQVQIYLFPRSVALVLNRHRYKMN